MSRCECGRRARPDGVCRRCAALDGDDLPRIARTVVSSLRVLGGGTIEALAEDAGVKPRRVQDGLAALRAARRARRCEWDAADLGRAQPGVSTPSTYELVWRPS